MKVSWTLDHALEVCVKFIEVSNGSLTVSVSKDVTSYTFHDLSSCNQFHFKVRIVNHQGRIGPWKYVETHVVDVAVSYPSSSEAHISWNFMEDVEECVDNVTVSGEDFEQIVHPNQSVLIPGLEVCRKYRFELTVGFRIGQTSRRMIDVQNNGKFKILISIDSDRVHWSYPSQGLVCVKGFKIKQEIPRKELSETVIVEVPGPFYSGNFSYKLFEPTETCVSRSITVTPIHDLNVEGSPTVLDVKHPDIEPVLDMIVDEHSANRVTLSWKKPTIYGECVREFQVAYLNQNITVPSNETSIAINDLDACRTYMFSISVIDMEGEVNSQAIKKVTIREETIGRVVDLRLFINTTRSVWLEWGAPIESPYCVKSYDIEKWYTDTDTRKLNMQSLFVSPANGR